MKNFSALLGIFTLLLLAACAPSQVKEGDDMMNDDGMMMEDDSMMMEGDEMMEGGMMEHEDSMMEEDAMMMEDARVIRVTAENWAFTPSVLSAKKGESVTISLQGLSGVHGFSVPDLGINERVEPGQTIEFSLPTEQAGTFSFRCSVPCGAGHRDMTGQIIIEE